MADIPEYDAKLMARLRKAYPKPTFVWLLYLLAFVIVAESIGACLYLAFNGSLPSSSSFMLIGFFTSLLIGAFSLDRVDGNIALLIKWHDDLESEAKRQLTVRVYRDLNIVKTFLEKTHPELTKRFVNDAVAAYRSELYEGEPLFDDGFFYLVQAEVVDLQRGEALSKDAPRDVRLVQHFIVDPHIDAVTAGVCQAAAKP